MVVLMWSTAFRTPRKRKKDWSVQEGVKRKGGGRHLGDWGTLGESHRHLCLSNAVCPHPLAPGPHRYQWRPHWGLQPGKDLEEDIR